MDFTKREDLEKFWKAWGFNRVSSFEENGMIVVIGCDSEGLLSYLRLTLDNLFRWCVEDCSSVLIMRTMGEAQKYRCFYKVYSGGYSTGNGETEALALTEALAKVKGLE